MVPEHGDHGAIQDSGVFKGGQGARKPFVMQAKRILDLWRMYARHVTHVVKLRLVVENDLGSLLADEVLEAPYLELVIGGMHVGGVIRIDVTGNVLPAGLVAAGPEGLLRRGVPAPFPDFGYPVGDWGMGTYRPAHRGARHARLRRPVEDGWNLDR